MKIITIILCLLWLAKDSHAEDRVRLADGKTPNEGFIQIQINDTKWGTLLDYRFFHKNEYPMTAFVVCRMLNYTMAIKADTVWYDLDSVNNTYWPYALHCLGTEGTISNCRHRLSSYTMWKDHHEPLPYRAIYAVCGNLSQVDQLLEVRLNGTNQRNYGFLEVRNKSDDMSAWKRICIGFSNWDTNANVVCKMLGYKQAVGGLLFRPSGDSWSKSLPYRRIYYECQGKESRIEECAQFESDHSCSSSRDYYVGVLCENHAIPPPVQYRLSNNKVPNIGFPQVKHRNVWGSVCGRLDRSTSDFICKQLGYLGVEFIDTAPLGIHRPKTLVLWELNKLCTISSNGNCSHGDIWKLSFDRICDIFHAYSIISCKVASAPRYHLVGGCPPLLIINTAHLSNKEKQLITYYQVTILGFLYNKWAVFYIPANTTALNIGDNKTYVRGLNRPLEIGKEYYVNVRAVYEDKNGNLGYGSTERQMWRLPYVKISSACPTSQVPEVSTTLPSNRSSNEQTSVVANSRQSFGTEEIVGILVGVLLVIVIAGIAYVVCKKPDSPQQGPEHVQLNSVTEDQKA